MSNVEKHAASGSVPYRTPYLPTALKLHPFCFPRQSGQLGQEYERQRHRRANPRASSLSEAFPLVSD